MAPTNIAEVKERPNGILFDRPEETIEYPPLRTVWPHLKLENHPIDDVPKIRVVVVGAGVSGITAGVLLPIKVPHLSLVIYERQSNLGGVWNANVYPGVRCDVPSHAYQSTFAPSTTWTEAYAQGHEIKEYWQKIADQYHVQDYIKFNSSVSSAEWSQDKGKWLISVKTDGTTFVDEANFLITATGHFSDPSLPSYPGMEEFQGHLRHSSNWDPSFDPTGKRIAVIGNGASGIQVLPQLQKKAKHIDHYARNKTWVAAPIGGEDLAEFVADNVEQARTGPDEYVKFRKQLESRLYSRFGSIFKGGPQNDTARENITKLMLARVGERDDLATQIIPDFAPNCRRLTPGPGYLEALTQPNVSLIATPIQRLATNGIQTVDGIVREVDAIICSTGHDVTFSTQFPIVANGVDLQSSWRPGGSPGFPDSYLGMAAPGFPNLLILLGPNSTGPSGTLCHSVENMVTYVAKVLRKASTQGIKSMAPSVAATRDFRAYCESFFPNTVMSQHCSSWYNGRIKGGRIHGVWPGSASHLNAVRREPRWEDWDYTYWNNHGNRFSWLGNGWTTKDVAVAHGVQDVDIDLTPWLQPEALTCGVDLRSHHENWWDP